MGASSVTTTSLQVLLFFLCFLLLLLLVSTGEATLNNTCNSKERRALLSFKQALTDPSNSLSSWSLHHNDDCCQWTGVRCHNFTGAVTQLDLQYSQLGGSISPSLLQLESLSFLDLSGNDLHGEIPAGIGQLKHLEFLQLDKNKLNGSIPRSVGNLTSLKRLSLSDNQLSGTIPETVGLLSNLKCLWVSINNLSGTIPETVRLLSNLEELILDTNPMLRGIVSEANLSRFSNLKILSLAKSQLSLSFDPSWNPPFQLEYADLGFIKIGPHFPSWLRSQTSLDFLDMSGTGISDTVPDWFWELASGIKRLKLSRNQIEGDLTHVFFNSTFIDLSHNCFKGQLPQLSSNVKVFSVGNNTISGPISTLICGESHRNNQVESIDISNNNLSGELSDCWMHWRSLVHLNLGSNNLSGKIPISIGFLYDLINLQLNQNRLSGDIPLSLKNCSSLDFINLGENELTGLIPNWFGEMEYMRVFRLGSNKFSGNIPVQLCQLPSIIVLDLANNNLSGTLPKCLSNISSMANGSTDHSNYSPGFEYGYSQDWLPISLELVTKGTESVYTNILRLVRLIDFSNNRLSGSIPDDISGLAGLPFLNLSRNHLVGGIPKKLGNMTNLESLDLSRNQLSGEIPGSMSELSFLSHLDLSYNNLSGEIPLSTQLQSLNESSFVGNVGLCGAPLEKRCRYDTPQGPKTDAKGDAQEESEDVMFWFYIGVGSGFACAFCGVCSTLYFNTTWRKALFQFLEDVINQVYVFALVTVNRIKRRLKRSNVSVG